MRPMTMVKTTLWTKEAQHAEGGKREALQTDLPV
jgi:hypothetical protein